MIVFTVLSYLQIQRIGAPGDFLTLLVTSTLVLILPLNVIL